MSLSAAPQSEYTPSDCCPSAAPGGSANDVILEMKDGTFEPIGPEDVMNV